MLISDMNGQADAEIDYKRKYKNLKRKLKFLVYVSPIILKYAYRVFFFLLFFQVYAHPPVRFKIWALLQEQECFQEELRRAQRKLLKISRDKRSIPVTWT